MVGAAALHASLQRNFARPREVKVIRGSARLTRAAAVDGARGRL